MTIKYLLVSLSIPFLIFISAPHARADGWPTEQQRAAIAKAHPTCGYLIIYAITVAGVPHVDDNFELADKLAASTTNDPDKRDTVAQGYRTVNIWVNQHKELTPHAVQKHWTSVCEQIEQCGKSHDPQSAACINSGAAFAVH